MASAAAPEARRRASSAGLAAQADEAKEQREAARRAAETAAAGLDAEKRRHSLRAGELDGSVARLTSELAEARLVVSRGHPMCHGAFCWYRKLPLSQRRRGARSRARGQAHGGT